jgi:hypothetical protein
MQFAIFRAKKMASEQNKDENSRENEDSAAFEGQVSLGTVRLNSSEVECLQKNKADWLTDNCLEFYLEYLREFEFSDFQRSPISFFFDIISYQYHAPKSDILSYNFPQANGHMQC